MRSDIILKKLLTKPLVSLGLFQVKSLTCFKESNSELCCLERRRRAVAIRTPSDKKAHSPQEESGIHMI